MENGMATTKITVSLDDDMLAAVHRVVDAGGARSVSGFVQHAIGLALNDVAGWAACLHLALGENGGPPTRKERAWADEILTHGKPKRRRPKAA
jgi:hypothetical protein